MMPTATLPGSRLWLFCVDLFAPFVKRERQWTENLEWYGEVPLG